MPELSAIDYDAWWSNQTYPYHRWINPEHRTTAYLQAEWDKWQTYQNRQKSGPHRPFSDWLARNLERLISEHEHKLAQTQSGQPLFLTASSPTRIERRAWEYQVLRSTSELLQQLEALGQDGWELVTRDSHDWYYFKRPTWVELAEVESNDE